MEESCADCRFYKARTLNDFPTKEGLCRINPPIHDKGFPETYEGGWCGEYTSKTATTTAQPVKREPEPLTPGAIAELMMES